MCITNFYSQEKCDTYSVVKETKSLHPVNQQKDSLLHMAASSSSKSDNSNFLDPEQSDIFPCESVVNYLLKAGFDPNTVNDKGETSLHVAAKNVSIVSIIVFDENYLISRRTTVKMF